VNKYDLRSLILNALHARNVKLNDRVNPVRFSCVRERHRSSLTAWLGDGAWGCHACGIDGQPHETLARELGIDVPKRGGFTVDEYAERKHFTLPLLAAWGVHDADGKYGPVVAIPYRDASGALLRTKFRTRTGTFWHDDGKDLHLYGLDMLAKYPEQPVLLVEGESDCHAAWHHKVLALGLPGAGTWRSEWRRLLDGREVYVWQEPGEAGSKMVRKIAPDLPDARVIDHDGTKDLADLHIAVGVGFKAAIEARIAGAYRIDRLPPVAVFDPLIGDTLDRIRTKKLEPIDAVPTMIPTWNSHCRDSGGGVGLARGWHITIGAKSGRGKSVIALNLAVTAVRAGDRVAFISLEMTQEQLATRYLAIASGASIRELEQGRGFSTITWSAATHIVNDLYAETGGCTYVNRSEISKLDDVITCMRYEHEVHGCRYMIVDYLQVARATATSQRENDILEQMTLVSGAIRRTARELNVVSVALSQFNRQTSGNNEVPPAPEGLMGGSPIENDSDQVILLDHSTYERVDDHAITRLLLAKNRHGSMTEINVKLDFRCLRLTEIATPQNAADSDGDAPVAYAPHNHREDEISEAAEPEQVSEQDLQFVPRQDADDASVDERTNGRHA
jgi:hypothetical protein